MNIALLGGAFNPPHLGHQLISQQVLDFVPDISEVWLLPNYGQNYYGQKPYKTVAPVAERLAMTRLLETSRIKTSTLEIDNKLDGQTVHLLPHLPKDHKFSFIIGSDQLPTFHLWDGWQKLLASMRFLIFPRHGYSVEPLYEGMQVVTSDLLVESNVSSTKIRNRISDKLPLDGFVPPTVVDYIAEHGLYLEGARKTPEKGL